MNLEEMENEMNSGELIEMLAKENQTWKILEILNESKDLAEAKKKVIALLEE